MNSGMRLSVTIIVLVVIALGLYYASLDDDRGGVAEPTVPATSAEPGQAKTPANNGAAVVAETAEPVESVEPTVPTPEPVQPGDPLAGDDASAAQNENSSPEPAFDPEGVDDDSSSAEGGDDHASLEPSVDEDPEADRARGDGLELAEADPTATEGMEEGGPDVATDVAEGDADTIDAELLDGIDPDPRPGETESTSDRPSPEPRLPGRSAAESGLGAHVIVCEDDSFGILFPAASLLANADPELVIVPAGDGLAWLAIPTALRDSKFLETAVILTNDENGVEFMLVREDLGGSLALGGRIAEAETAGLPGGDRFRVRYRVLQDEVEPVRRDSSVLIGQPVAWLVDGGVVGISKPRITISQRSVLPILVDEATAARLAKEIVRSADESSSRESDPVVEASAGSDAPDMTTRPRPGATPPETGRPARAGELPADQYTIYIIKPSDTPSSIALAWFGDANKYSLILQANPLIDPKLMMPGDQIKLPPKDYKLRTIIDVGDGDEPVIHIVQSGENLSGIALAAYGDASLWPRIYEANKSKIKDPSRLTVGTELIIP